MVCATAKRSTDAQTYLDQLCQMNAGIAWAHGLTQAFLAMVRERRGRDLEAWITEATHSGIDELARFARGLQDDLAAVTAGLTLAWSNGPESSGSQRCVASRSAWLDSPCPCQ
jgi:transposase